LKNIGLKLTERIGHGQNLLASIKFTIVCNYNIRNSEYTK